MVLPGTDRQVRVALITTLHRFTTRGQPCCCKTAIMAENKTKPTTQSVPEFLGTVEHPVRRADAWTLLDLMSEVTGEQAVMWGPSMVGFGSPAK